MEVSLIIATYNRAGPLIRLLGWLEYQTFDRRFWEVIVVIDGSTDDTRQRLAHYASSSVLPLKYFEQKNGGPAAARQRGISEASGIRIVTIDDDMEPSPEFILAHIGAAASNPSRTVVMGQILPTSNWIKKPLHDVFGEACSLKLHSQYKSGLRQPRGNELATGNASFPRQLYLDIGGFDRSLRVNEDGELGIRFELAHAKIVFSTAASAVHHSDVGRFATWKARQALYGKSRMHIWRKHGRNIDYHPLRDYVLGSRLNHLIVNVCMPADKMIDFTVALLRPIGLFLHAVGLLSFAIADYAAIRTLEYHRSVRNELGGWKPFNREAAKLKQDLKQVKLRI